MIVSDFLLVVDRLKVILRKQLVEPKIMYVIRLPTLRHAFLSLWKYLWANGRCDNLKST